MAALRDPMSRPHNGIPPAVRIALRPSCLLKFFPSNALHLLPWQTDYRFPYVEGHRYEFQAAPTQSVVLAVQGEDRHGVTEADESTASKAGLQVSFSVVSSYAATERLPSEDAARLCLPHVGAPSTRLATKAPPRSRISAPVKAEKPPTSPLGDSACELLSSTQDARSRDDGKRPFSLSIAAAPLDPCLSQSSGRGHDHTEMDETQTSPMHQTSLAAAPRPLEEGPFHGANTGRERAGVWCAEDGLSRSAVSGVDCREIGGSAQCSGHNVRSQNRDEHLPSNKPAAAEFYFPRKAMERSQSPLQSGVGGTVWVTDDRGSGAHYKSVVAIENPYSFQSAQTLGPSYLERAEEPRKDNGGWARQQQQHQQQKVEQLRWNPAWERPIPLSSPPVPSNQHSFPFIRRHIEASPRSFSEADAAVAYRSARDHGHDVYLRPGAFGSESFPRERRRQNIHGSDSSYYNRLSGERRPLHAECPSNIHPTQPPYRRGRGDGEKVNNSALNGSAARGRETDVKDRDEAEHPAENHGYSPSSTLAIRAGNGYGRDAI